MNYKNAQLIKNAKGNIKQKELRQIDAKIKMGGLDKSISMITLNTVYIL